MSLNKETKYQADIITVFLFKLKNIDIITLKVLPV